MSNQNFTARGNENLDSFREALSAISNLPSDLLTGSHLPNPLRMPSANEAGGGGGGDDGDGGVATPAIHVLVISDSPATIIVEKMASRGVDIQIKEDWTDGISKLSRATVTPTSTTMETGARMQRALDIDILAGGTCYMTITINRHR